MIFRASPEEFNPKFEVVSCLVEFDGKILLLHRQDRKPQGNTWGVPAGKIDEGESPINALLRELKEETGIVITESQLAYFDKLYVKYPEFDFVYYMFHLKLADKPSILINSTEHKTFEWASPEEALEKQLILDQDFCIKLFYKI